MSTTPAPASTEDHRIRVGAQRREKTRLRLLENALAVFNAKGPDLAVTEDFIAAAGVSRKRKMARVMTARLTVGQPGRGMTTSVRPLGSCTWLMAGACSGGASGVGGGRRRKGSSGARVRGWRGAGKPPAAPQPSSAEAASSARHERVDGDTPRRVTGPPAGRGC